MNISLGKIALGATLGCLAGSAMSGSLTLVNGSASGCSYSSMSADGSGNLTVNCTTVVTPGSPGTLQFSSQSYNVNEGSAAQIVVSRNGGSTGAVSVNWSVTGGTATAGTDYTTQSGGTLSFADGDAASKVISIPTTTDTLVEPAETILLSLASVVGTTLGSPASTTVNIADMSAPTTPTTPANCTVQDVTWPSNTIYQGPLLTVPMGGALALKWTPQFAGVASSAFTAYATSYKYVSISTNPCEFSAAIQAAGCGGGSGRSMDARVYYATYAVPGYCQLNAGTQYYINIRNSTTYNGSETCSGNCTTYLSH